MTISTIDHFSTSDQHQTYHPVRALSVKLSRLHLGESGLRLVPLLLRYELRDLHHLLDGVWLEQIFIVEVVEEDVDPLVHVINLGLERLRGDGSDASYFGG